MPTGTTSIQRISLVPESATASYSRCFDSNKGTSVVSPLTRTALQGSSPRAAPSLGKHFTQSLESATLAQPSLRIRSTRRL